MQLISSSHNLKACKKPSPSMTHCEQVLNRGQCGLCVMEEKTISKGLQLFTLIDVKILENVIKLYACKRQSMLLENCINKSSQSFLEQNMKTKKQLYVQGNT